MCNKWWIVWGASVSKISGCVCLSQSLKETTIYSRCYLKTNKQTSQICLMACCRAPHRHKQIHVHWNTYIHTTKRLKLEDPSTPEFCNEKSVKEVEIFCDWVAVCQKMRSWRKNVCLQIKSDFEEELNSAVSHLIREWVEKLLGIKFSSLSDLAAHLIEKMYVDNRSNQAFAVMSAMQKSVGEGKLKVNVSMLLALSSRIYFYSMFVPL